MATKALLTLLTVTTATTVMRPALRTITPNYMAAHIVLAGGLGPFQNHCSAAWAYLVAMLCITDYWQLLANAMADEREKMRFEFLTQVCYTCSTFGCGKERSWPCTIGMNKMGGMMEDEFNKYINNSICLNKQHLKDSSFCTHRVHDSQSFTSTTQPQCLRVKRSVTSFSVWVSKPLD